VPDHDSWPEIRRSRALNESNVRAYRAMLIAEQRLIDALQERMTAHQMAEAAGVPESEAWEIRQEVGDLHLFALARRIEAAGGHLEVRAVFDDEEVLLLREPEG
jgi:hypothetical protein